MPPALPVSPCRGRGVSRRNGAPGPSGDHNRARSFLWAEPMCGTAARPSLKRCGAAEHSHNDERAHPQTVTPPSAPSATEQATLRQAFQATVERRANDPALRGPSGVDWTWKAYADRVRAAAAGLTELGVRRGDTVACWMSNRPGFHVADTAAMHLGAAPFSIYPTYTVEQAEQVIATPAPACS